MVLSISEEIFDFSKSDMTHQKVNQLKETMTMEFGAIFELCIFVINTYIDNPSNVKNSLIKGCLKTFSVFLSWIPLGYIFETDLLEKLINHFLSVPNFRVETIKCMVEICILLY
jgi:exportin-1